MNWFIDEWLDDGGGTPPLSSAAPNSSPSPKGEGTGVETPETFEAFLAGQDEAVKGLYDGHVAGLKSALRSERESRGEAERKVRDLAQKADKGSEAEAALLKVADELAAETRRAGFYEVAHAAGVTNLKLAYLVAVNDDLFDKKGQVNFEELKKGYPELFGTKAMAKPPAGNVGAGQGNEPKQSGMNAFIRAASGR